MVEKLLVQCFTRPHRRSQQVSSLTSSTTKAPPINQLAVSINELRANMTMTALQQNKTSIATSLPPTKDALFQHCLRVSRQVRIWLQAPDPCVNFPNLQDCGFEMIDGNLRLKWMSELPQSNDRQLSCCGKHKGQCIRCVCISNQVPCTIFRQCSSDCPNRNSFPVVTSNQPRTMVCSLLCHVIDQFGCFFSLLHYQKRTARTSNIAPGGSRLSSILFNQHSSSEEESTDGSPSLMHSISAAAEEENNPVKQHHL